MSCKSCGDELDPRRVEFGYDYCTRDECQRRHLRRFGLARMGVNKAADQFVRADTVPATDLGPRAGAAPDEGDELDEADGAAPPPPDRPPRSGQRRPTAAERMRMAEAALDTGLERSYQRFCAGEINAREMDRERNALIDDFNARLLTKGVRYRHLLRPRV